MVSCAGDVQTALSGPIRLTAPTGFGSTKLVQALIPFLKEHPDVELDMKLTDNRVALVEEGFDLAVRIGALRDSTLIAKKLSDMELVLCAAPDYLNRHGRPSAPEALSTHVCLVDNNQVELNVWRFFSGGPGTCRAAARRRSDQLPRSAGSHGDRRSRHHAGALLRD